MKILIADDHALFRDGLSLVIEKLDNAATVLQTSSYVQTLKILEKENGISLIIIDLEMQGMSWQSGFDAIKEKAGSARILVLSASENIRNIREIMDNGACGYISKRAEVKTLSNALRLVMDGGTYVPPLLLCKEGGTRGSCAYSNGKSKGLTNRQEQVLELLAKGMSNKQIAYEIGVSEATVKLHINALLRSIGATNRTQAVIIAQKMGII